MKRVKIIVEDVSVEEFASLAGFVGSEENIYFPLIDNPQKDERVIKVANFKSAGGSRNGVPSLEVELHVYCDVHQGAKFTLGGYQTKTPREFLERTCDALGIFPKREENLLVNLRDRLLGDTG